MSLEAEEKLIVDEFKKSDCEEYLKRLLILAKAAKSTEKSVKSRKEGNLLFAKKKHGSKSHEKIWKLYTISIAFAMKGSEELGAGYSNRSALLIHLKKYNQCLDDIERSLKLTTSMTIKVKLYCRQAECYVALQEGNKKKNALEKAKYWYKKLEETDKNKKVMAEMIKKTEKIIEVNQPDLEKRRMPKELTCKNDAFYISFNKKYGRCLMAKCDIKPGEIVCIEKFYIASPNNDKIYAYCSHCLAVSWATIPCDSCSLYMYCSEKCKEEAWNKYHDIECVTKMEIDLSDDYYTQLSLRAVIMGIREAGSVKKLRNMINDVDKCTDNIKKGYTKNGEFSSISFKSLYSLSYRKSKESIDTYVSCAIKALIALAQNSTVFDKMYDWEDTLDMIKDDYIRFIGALLLRLVLIFTTNAFHVIDSTVDCKYKHNPMECAHNACCPRGLTFSPVAALINHSCNNNVGKIYDNNGQVIYFALCPIKKETQIFTAYYCHYTKLSKFDRQEVLSNNFEFQCDCVPCREDWPQSHDPSKSGGKKASRLLDFNYMISHEILMKNKDLINSLRIKDRTYKEKTLRKFLEDVEKLYQHTKQPSPFIEVTVRMLQALFRGCYGIQLRIPKTCRS